MWLRGKSRVAIYGTLSVAAVIWAAIWAVWFNDPQHVGGLLPALPAIFTGGIGLSAEVLRGNDTLRDAADRVAGEVEARLVRVVGEQKLQDPEPIEVWWTLSRDRSVSHWGGRFPVLPGGSDAAAVDGGGLDGLFSLFAGLRCGRLVVLGGPGRGKSAVAVLTVLEALERRKHVADNRLFPVPVLLNAAAWNPHWRSLRDWVADQLYDQYPFLATGKYGGDAAAELVTQGHIAVFLDGFDEMRDAWHQEAITELRGFPDARVVLFSRTKEFDTATGGTRVQEATEELDTTASGTRAHGAVVVELAPVTSAAASGFLELQAERFPERAQSELCQGLVEELRERRGSAAARALRSPLTLTLVRDALTLVRDAPTLSADPDALAELRAPGRFAEPEEFERYLLDQFLNVAYRPRAPVRSASARRPHRRKTYRLDKARNWLRSLAAWHHDRPGHTLDWRHLHWWAPPLPRIAMTTVAGVLVALPASAVAFSAWGGTRALGHGGIGFGLLWGALLGLLSGAAVGAISELRDPSPEYARRFITRGAERRDINPVVGVLVAALVTYYTVREMTNYSPELGTYVIWLYCLTAGLGTGAIAARAAAGRNHRTLTRADGLLPTVRSLSSALHSRISLATGAAAGVCIGCAFGISHRDLSDGLTAGLFGALAGGLITGAARSAERRDTEPDRAWLTDCWQSALFGLAFGTCMGVFLGSENMGPERNGLREGLIVGVCAAIPFALAAGAAVSDAWRNTTLFLQLARRGAFPARGMRFLKDAHERGVLRTVGPSYQFRHAQLQEALRQDRSGVRTDAEGRGGSRGAH